MRIGLQMPERLQQATADGVFYGFSQDWYTDEWRQRAGCGPTTATCLLAYCLGRDGDWPSGMDRRQIRYCMDNLWEYVTPSYGGLYKTRWMADGLRRYLAAREISRYAVEMLAISVLPAYRPSAAAVVEFIRAGLEADSPVAFLNRHAGNETEIDGWHWVPIVELDTDSETARAVCYDEGIRKSFAPAAWNRETLLGGGLVYLRPRAGQDVVK